MGSFRAGYPLFLRNWGEGSHGSKRSVDMFLFPSVPDSLAMEGCDHQPPRLNRVGNGRCDDLPRNLQMSVVPELG